MCVDCSRPYFTFTLVAVDIEAGETPTANNEVIPGASRNQFHRPGCYCRNIYVCQRRRRRGYCFGGPDTNDLRGASGVDTIYGAGDDSLDGGSGSCAGQAGTNDTAVNCESESTIP